MRKFNKGWIEELYFEEKRKGNEKNNPRQNITKQRVISNEEEMHYAPIPVRK